jgi:hypothetical protein
MYRKSSKYSNFYYVVKSGYIEPYLIEEK